MSADRRRTEFGPWNPGIQSQIPRSFLPLSTMFRPENVFTSVEQAHELRDFTGIATENLATFRPERLVVHELLIRITADLSVPDGQKYEDLGINFREMTETVIKQYIAPHMEGIVRSYDELKQQASEIIANELSSKVFTRHGDAVHSPRKRGLARLFDPGPRKNTPAENAEDREQNLLAEWSDDAESADDRLTASTYKALLEIATAIIGKRGRLLGDETLLTSLVANRVMNEYGSEIIGEMIEPYIRQAAKHEGYQLLPSQDRPVVMNVKGASASGKSTMRPLQHKLADELDVRWADFALISPDIWRKYLLDYESLGVAEKYAGPLTGHEVKIIDQKLDRYMASKAENGSMSHLLIDRFRFDSFAPEADGEAGSRLLTRFGDLIYMFFMITPPDQTVERAWKRGLEFGRYKAVDDLLDHNVEAYTGMPHLFFTWALRDDKNVHYEFLDNSVPEGHRPRTVAFGWNAELNILDIKCVLDVDRYRKINIDAKRPEDVYADDTTMAPENNTAFLHQCARLVPAINFADYETGRVYARAENGAITWIDRKAFAQAIEDPDARAGLDALGPAPPNGETEAPRFLNRSQAQTLGQWGDGAAS